jgi:phosphatidylglycerol:prolipoprotein diacylglycerol transferase
VAFTIGSFSLRWYAVMVLLAIAFLVWWSAHFARKRGYDKDFVIGAALWAIPLGIIGAKLVHVVDDLSYYVAHPAEIANPGGFAIFGAILGAMLGVWIYCRIRRVSFAPLGDVMAPGIILAQAIGRVGCTINGCCYGTASSLSWVVTWTHPNTYAPLGVPVHPTQVYELLWDLLVFAILWWLLRGRLKPSGSLFAAYLALYSLGSFLIRFLRGDVNYFVGILNEGQFISLLVLIVAASFLIAQFRALRRPIWQD